MPNWVTNQLFIMPSKENTVAYEKDKNINGVSLNDIVDSVNNEEDETVLDFNKIIESPKDDTWYEWCRTNWGTKWNAVEAEVDVQGLFVKYGFKTAWSCPVAAIKKLSEKFKGFTFEIAFFDEDIGYNTGRITINNGDVLEWYKPEDGSQEAYHFIADNFGGDEELEMYGIVLNEEKGEYVYDEETEEEEESVDADEVDEGEDVDFEQEEKEKRSD